MSSAAETGFISIFIILVALCMRTVCQVSEAQTKISTDERKDETFIPLGIFCMPGV